MTDTDDTDLLLLIPPDFFLVHSPDFSDSVSDCDSNLHSRQSELRNSVVSDLITQVNDLESRICMIENCGSAQFTTHGSFSNEYSVNSLTESDMLRCQDKEKSALIERQFSESQFILEEIEKSIDSGNDLVQKQSTDSQTKPIFNEESISVKTDQTIHLSKRDVSHTEVEDSSPKTKENHSDFLHEVDLFLETKKKQEPLTYDIAGEYLGNQHCSSSVLQNITLPFRSDEIVSSHNECDIDYQHNSLEKTLALPEVYKLLMEMEEQQQEIEKKLKLNFSKECLHAGSFGDDKMRLVESRNTCYPSLTTGMGDVYSECSNPLFTKKTENILKRLQSTDEQKHKFTKPVNNTNPQVSYLFKPPQPVLNEDKALHSKDMMVKSLSPRKVSVGYNPLDIVKANLPRKDGKGSFNFKEDAYSSTNSRYKEHPNCERMNLVFQENRTKTRPIQIEQSSNQSKAKINEIGYFIDLPNIKCNDEKPNVPTSFQAVRSKPPRLNVELENKTSKSEVLQQKISSNNLLSLSELWNKEPTFYSDDPTKLRKKLEEEKYRRQHCEQQIQELQLRVLEEQEKLAVAIKVDQEKDKAILQITESWRQMNDHWNELEEQRHSLATQLQLEKESSKTRSYEILKKEQRWEKEVSQALDLAAGYKEKSEELQKQLESLKREFEDKIIETTSQLHHLKKDNDKINEENNNLSIQIETFKERIKEEEGLLSKLKVELENLEKLSTNKDAEIHVLKEKIESLSCKVKDERNRCGILEQQKSSIQQALNEALKREKAAVDEVRMSNERMEVTRTELRALYQGQLENVVKEKLQEFQTQLEAAEASLKAELHSKEKEWSDKASEQYKKLQERQKIELQRLDESHKEEINKWKIRLMESERLRSISESRLQEESNMRAIIAQKFHSVMETKWREALDFISNPLQEAYESQNEDNRSKWSANQCFEEKRSRDLKASRSNSSTLLAQHEEIPFCKEGMVTCRISQIPQDVQLKKYIQMCLEKRPGDPLPQDSLNDSQNPSFCQISDLLSNRMVDTMDKLVGQSERPGNSSKPPWK